LKLLANSSLKSLDLLTTGIFQIKITESAA